MKIGLTLAAGLTLTACGGSSTGGNLSFAQIAARTDPLVDRFENATSTPINNLPTSGAANYSGVMAMETDVRGRVTPLAGLADLRVGFGANTMTGTITNVVNENNQAYRGQLNLRNGRIDRSGNSSVFPGEAVIGSDLAGQLTSPSGQRHVFDGGALLGFGNANYAVAGGLIGGDVTVNGSTGSFLGAIVAER